VALDTFVPPVNPAPQSSRPVKPRTNVAQFGDGYSQRSDDGLNASNRSFQAQWPILSVSQLTAIESFMEDHSTTPFLWTPPLQAVERKWRAVDWAPGYAGGDSVSLSVNLVEVFDL
jgi:phage-related protein